MASAPGRWYTYVLLGFGRDFDRRPMEFLEPFQPARVCSLCGVVPDRAALLPCRDVVCPTCYSACRATDQVCPLHSRARFHSEDIEWIPLPLSDVSKRKARCWNTKNGCDVVTEAWSMAEHCYNDCLFYHVSCRKCGKRVLQKDIVEHLRNGCASNILRWTEKAATNNEAEGNLDSFERSSVPSMWGDPTTAAEVTKSLRRLLNEHVSLRQDLRKLQEHVTYERKQSEMVITQCLDGARLDTLTSMKDHVTEANNLQNDVCMRVVEELGNIAECINKRLESIESERTETMNNFQEQMNKEFTRTIQVCTKTLQFASSIPNIQEWVVLGWAALKGKAAKQGEAWYYSNPRYFHGYHLSSALLVRKDGEGDLMVHVGLRVVMGTNDDHLEWPFTRTCKLTFVHCGYRAGARSLTFTPNLELTNHCLGKPEGVTQAGVCSAGDYCFARDLENEGYVSADEIRVRFEVLS